MESDKQLVERHVKALLEEAAKRRVPNDVIGRFLLQATVELWRQERPWQDVARELAYVAESLDPDFDHEFMRP